MSITFLLVAATTCLSQPNSDETLFRDGAIEVRKVTARDSTFRRALFINRVYFGNFEPSDDPLVRRRPTTYYHRNGAVGAVFLALDRPRSVWGEFRTDARMPAHLVGSGCSPVGLSGALVALWSEPPIAVCGMHSGTIASYAHPFQPIDFYERNPKIIALSQPKDGEPMMTAITDARSRGAQVRIFEGLPRSQLGKVGPKGYYRWIFVEMTQRVYLEDIESELITKEGMKACLDALAPGGVVCFHTSNRYVDIAPVIRNSAKSLKSEFVNVLDEGGNRRGQRPAAFDPDHFGAQWGMISRDTQSIRRIEDAARVTPALRIEKIDSVYAPVWSDKAPSPLRGIMLGSHPDVQRLEEQTFILLSKFVSYDQLYRSGADRIIRRIFRAYSDMRLWQLSKQEFNSNWLRKTN